jgi:tRNA A37 threonylcarbamoyladenosine dehydratase
VAMPLDGSGAACDVDGTLSCHGYGSSVAVTATFGMVAAAETIALLTAAPARRAQPEAEKILAIM